MKFLVSSLALLVAAPAAQDRHFENIWRSDGPALEAEGITKPMARQAFLWTEIQYHLGRCLPYISEGDLLHWRMWWRDTALERSSLGQEILKIGDKGYYSGIEDGRSKPLTKNQCQRVIASWQGDMKRAVEPTD